MYNNKSKIYEILKKKKKMINDNVIEHINKDKDLINMCDKQLKKELISKLKDRYTYVIINSIDSKLLKDKNELTKFIVNIIFDDTVIDNVYNIGTLEQIEIKKHICDYFRTNYIYKERE